MKTILFICPYDNIYPPMNGGMQRCFHILNQLAQHFKVTAIIHQDKTAFEKAFSNFPELASIALYSTKNANDPKDLFSFLPGRIKNALRYRWYKRTLKATTDSNFLLYYPVLKNLLKKQKYDAVILENLDTINAVDILRRYDTRTTIIYDTHNVGSLMAEVDFAKGIMDEKSMHSIKYFENTLYKTVDAIMACSDNDLQEFKKINPQQLEGAVIPNGVHLEDSLFDNGVQLTAPEYIIFCGSLAYEPNLEGLTWFYSSIWPSVKKQYPSLKLLVLGSGSLPANLQHMQADSSLLFTGSVEDVKPWYDKASIAIVPLKSGSGTRLKILEAMGLGLPVISTRKGAEGIQYRQGENIVIADDEKAFSNELIALIAHKEKRVQLQIEARQLMEDQYDWNKIGVSMKEFISRVLDQKN